MAAKYDSIGINYAELRKPEPRIATAIWEALGPATTILNVGAGTGSYEPADRQVTAVEPSLEMIRKRGPSSAKAIQASAAELPFGDNEFDAAMAILTVHHWPDKQAGLKEMRRVTRGPIVLLTFDPAHRPWLTDYLPELASLDQAQMPAMADYRRWLGPVRVTPVLIPHDCRDGFLYAYWRRPLAYLDAPSRLHHLKPGASIMDDWDLRASHNWYDFVVTCVEAPSFQRRLAGHCEDGKPSLSDPLLGRQA